MAVPVVFAGYHSVTGQEIVDLGQKSVELGTVDHMKSRMAGAKIMFVVSHDPAIATARKAVSGDLEITPHNVGKTTVEYWDSSARKYFQIGVSVVQAGSDPTAGYLSGTIKFEGGEMFAGRTTRGHLELATVSLDNGGPMGLIAITWREVGTRSSLLITDYRPKEGTVNYRVTYDGNGNPIKTEARRSSAAVAGSWIPLNEADKKALKEWELIISYGEK